jgi:hypothetical protein
MFSSHPVRVAVPLVLAVVASVVGVVAAPPASADVVRPICFPVEGNVTYVDTFGAPRGDHLHQGEDLMGVKLQRLLAANDATVSAIKHDPSGNYVFLTDAEGWQYWYIHVNNDTPGTDDGANPIEWAFAPGIKLGARVHAGEFIAYMGDSGDAEGVGPHLHFELHQPDGTWGGLPINPFASLQAAKRCPVVVPAETYAPFADADTLVIQQYRDFLAREPDRSGLTYWPALLEAGTITPVGFVLQLMTSPEFEAVVAPIARLYFAYFGRIPDYGGLTYWITQHQAGLSLAAISDGFAGSGEFQARFGAIDATGFVKLVYENVLGREPDPGGLAFWVNQLGAGMTRGALMVGFSESAEYRAKIAPSVNVVMAYIGMLRRSPDQGGFDYWRQQSIVVLVDGMLKSAEYAARFPKVG